MNALSTTSHTDQFSALKMAQKLVPNPLLTDFGRLLLKTVCELYDAEQIRSESEHSAFQAAQKERGRIGRLLHLPSRPAPFEGVSPGQIASVAPISAVHDILETLIALRTTGLISLTWRNLPEEVDMRSLRYQPTTLGRQLLAASEQPQHLPALPIYFVTGHGNTY